MRNHRKVSSYAIDREGYSGSKAEGCAIAMMLLAVPVLLIITLAEWIIKGGEHPDKK